VEGPRFRRIPSAIGHPDAGDRAQGPPGEFAYALRIGAELLLLEENYFGIAYPYEKLDQVAVPDYAYGPRWRTQRDPLPRGPAALQEGRSAEESRIDVGPRHGARAGAPVVRRLWSRCAGGEAWLNESFATLDGESNRRRVGSCDELARRPGKGRGVRDGKTTRW